MLCGDKYMKTKNIILLLILAVFCVGVFCGTVSAAHTVKVGKYKVKLTNKQYNHIKKCERTNTEGGCSCLKTGKYYIYKKKVKGKYKKFKDPIYMNIRYSPGGMAPKGIFARVWSYKYWANHDNYDIIHKKIKL